MTRLCPYWKGWAPSSACGWASVPGQPFCRFPYPAWAGFPAGFPGGPRRYWWGSALQEGSRLRGFQLPKATESKRSNQKWIATSYCDFWYFCRSVIHILIRHLTWWSILRPCGTGTVFPKSINQTEAFLWSWTNSRELPINWKENKSSKSVPCSKHLRNFMVLS